VVLSDIRMPGMDGMTLLQRLGEVDPDLPVILITGHAEVSLAVQAMRHGAYDFIEKPFAAQGLVAVLRRALDHRGLVLDNRRLRAAAGQGDDLEARLPGRSAAVIDLRYRLRAIGASEADALIVGPTGAGKEVVARAMHDLSPRAAKPFVAVNCAALPAQLIESELFGHEAGAFPGAMRARFGRFEHARGGTVLLDEVGSMPLDVQAKLLRVLQERIITRLGSNDPVVLDVRFIATSKTDLAAEVARGAFREDLYWRLNVALLRVPPLSARREDIPLLFLQLVREAAARHSAPDRVPEPEMLADLAARDWPGNVRELRNAADRFVLGLDWMPGATGPELRLAERVAGFERSVIAGAIAAHGGHLRRVYEQLGVSRKTLYEKMQKHGLDRRLIAEDEGE
jgi:two-component system C4-dicarboxylate transport response regulator DctD